MGQINVRCDSSMSAQRNQESLRDGEKPLVRVVLNGQNYVFIPIYAIIRCSSSEFSQIVSLLIFFGSIIRLVVY